MNEKMILEKLRFISEEFFIIFTSAMLIWALIGTLPVHAEEASTWNISSNTGDYSCMSTSYSIKAKYYYKQETNFSLTDDSLYYAFVLDSYDSSLQIYTASLYAYRLADTQKPYKYRFSDADAPMCYGYVSYTTKDEFQQNSSVGVYTPAFTLFKEDYSGGAYTEYEYETQLPIFESVDAMYSYCLTGDKSGMYSEPASPDVSDESYTYTGFSMNGKTASWTGTTQRSHLLDQDVEEYTTFTYGFASSEDQTVSSFIEYDGEYATADKKLKLPWDEMEAKKKDGEFIRQVNITPCYRVPGAFYRGVGAKVYFHKDGSIDKIVRDFPQSTGDYSYKHIFSADKYSTDIPAPELSAVSHNGFTLLNNSDNQYYVDIILESSFYGVKMEKDAGTWLPVVDTDWVYNKHYYNFADTSQIAINNDVVYIPNLYSVNPENELITDFKNWSSDYPTYSKLPTMSFLKRGTPARVKYEDQFLYKENSKYTDSEQIRFSHQAESVFYVRYYNKSMVYGPWVRYKFRDAASVEVPGGNLGGAIIDVGQVDVDEDGNVKVDENGNPVVSDNVHGRQDYNTGESNFNDGSFSLSLSDVNSFFDYIQEIFKSITGSLSSFGSLVAACFGFLPSKLINAIIFGIVLMMFIGLIKVIKG